MAKALKYKVGQKVLIRLGAGGYSPIEEEAIIIFAERWKNNIYPPYIVRTKKLKTFLLERDIKRVL
jgi:hypothetical protein